MVRFVVCRKGDTHVVAARDGDLLVLQLVAPQIGLAGMVTTVLGSADPAPVEPLTGVASELADCTTPGQLTRYGIAPTMARLYTDIVSNPSSWVEIVASQRHPGAPRRTPLPPRAFSTQHTAGWCRCPARSAANSTEASCLALNRICSGPWTVWSSCCRRDPGWIRPSTTPRREADPQLLPHQVEERTAIVDLPGNNYDTDDLGALDFSGGATTQSRPSTRWMGTRRSAPTTPEPNWKRYTGSPRRTKSPTSSCSPSPTPRVRYR